MQMPTLNVEETEAKARDRLGKARALLMARVITADEYVDVIDDVRKDVGLGPLPSAYREEAVKGATKLAAGTLFDR
jgi:hypothetical protein